MGIVEYLKKYVEISPQYQHILDTLVAQKKISKGKMIIESDMVSSKLYFLESGIVRSFYIKNDKEITHKFFMENSFFMSIEGCLKDEPSIYAFEAADDCVVSVVDYKLFDKLIPVVPGLESLVRQLMFDVIIHLSEKLRIIQFQSAQDRYEALLELYPDLVNKVSLGHIASYLGITQQTLSNIRAIHK